MSNVKSIDGLRYIRVTRRGGFLTAAILFATSAPLLAQSANLTVEEVQSLRNELHSLRRQVRTLEDRIDSMSVGTPAENTADFDDPLAQMEAEIEAMKTPSRQNARTAYNPQLTVVGDFTYSTSSLDTDPALPDAAGDPTGDFNRDRFSMRELEIAFQSNIDPYSRANVFLALPGVLEEFEDSAAAANAQKIEVEEAYLDFWRLPWGLQSKAGKFRLEFGKNNRLHTHALEASDRPFVIADHFGEEGIREQGVGLQKVVPLTSDASTQVEFTAQILNGEGGEESLFAGPGSDRTMGLGRVKLYHEFSPNLVTELGHSFLNGRHDPQGQFRQRIQGYDFTLRYEPLDQLLFRRFLLRAEFIEGERKIDNMIDQLNTDGLYVMLLHQWDRRWRAGYRYDNSKPAVEIVESLALGSFDFANRRKGNSVWLTYEHTEFNRWRLQYQRTESNYALAGNKDREERLVFQWTWAVGPHGAHPY